METRIDYRWTLAILGTIALAWGLLQSLVIPAIPTFEKTLHTTETGAAWVLTAYLLSAAVATPILGRVGDIAGKKRILIVTLILMIVGTVVCGLATSLPLLIVGRTFQGGAGAIFPLAFGIIRDEFPPHRVVLGIGLLSAILGFSTGAGVVLAGPIIEHLSVHWLFWIPGIVVVGATAAAAVVVPESPPRGPGSISWPGALVLSVWLVTLLLAIAQAPEWGWTSGRVLGLLASVVVLVPVWIVVEARSKSPLVDMTIMRLRPVWATNLSAMLFGFGTFAMFVTVPQFVQTSPRIGYGFGDSVTKSGIDLLPYAVAMLVVAPFVARLSEVFGAKWVLVGGGVVSAGAYAVLAAADAYQWSVLVASGLLGVGMGLGFAAMATLVVHAVPASQTAVATGMNANVRSIGGALGAGISASVVAGHMGPGGIPALTGYTTTFVLSALAMLGSAATAFAVPRADYRRAPEAGKHPALVGVSEVEVGATALAAEAELA